jgi:hypothetical protein
MAVWQYGSMAIWQHNKITDEMKKDNETAKVNETIEIDQDNL